MADKVLENNQVSIVGEIVSDFEFSHEVYGGSGSKPTLQLCGLHSADGFGTTHRYIQELYWRTGVCQRAVPIL